MAEKQNDMLSLKIFNPDATLSQLNLAGISADNTQLKPEQDYAKLESVQSQPQFLDQSGTFDKAKFHQFYQDAQKDYNILASTANNQTIYSKYNIFAPVNQRNWNPEFEIKKFNNPFEQTRGLAGIGELGEQKKSIEEIAQTQKVWDPKTRTWQDAPNDSFFGNFKDTRFLAQYEEDVDEIDPETGELVHHYAGEFKLNDEGKPYYENANGRSINGKTVLHLSDVFTTDGSAMNSIDFLDSDDMHKSALGTLAKNTALIGSMFLPGVGPYVAGLVVLQNSMQLGSVLGKMITSVDNPVFNRLEGFSHFTNLQESKSQYSKDPDHMWSLENTINLIGDTVGQLQTQRFLFKYAPSLFKGKYGYTKEGDELLKAEKFNELSKYNSTKLGKIKDPFSSKYAQAKSELDMANSMKAAAEVEKYMKEYYNIGGVISKAYMTGITVQDMFQEAKDAGANDISAIGLTLGYAAAEYALLTTGLGEWILPELRLARAENKQIFKTLLSPARTTFKEGVQTLNSGVEKAVTRQERHNIFKKAVDFGRKIANADYSILKKSAGSIAAGALGEGTEEVSEELLADAVRKIHDVVPWLRGSDGKEMFSTDRIFDRYLQNFVGGFIGGGIAGLGFEGSDSAYKQYRDLENMTSEQAMQRMIYKLRNEKNAGKELRDTVRKMDWGSKNLAAFKFAQDENKNTFFDEAKTYEESQDYAIKQAAYKQIDLVESVLQTIKNEGGASISDKSILDANTLKDLRLAMFQNSTAAGQLIENFNSEIANMVKAQTNLASMNSIEGKESDNVPDQKGEQNQKSMHEQNIQEEQKKFDIAKQNALDILTGRKATKFMTRAIIELNPSIAKSFMIATFDQFVQQNLHKKVSELTDDEKTVQYNKYVEYCKTAKKDSLEFAEQSYLNMVKLVNQNFVPALEEAYKGFSQINALDETLTNFYDSLKELRLGTLSPIPQLRQDPDDYVVSAQATSPGSVQELIDGTVQTRFKLDGLQNLALALSSQGDQVAINYLQTMQNINPNDEDFQDKALGAIIPFAVHGLETIVEQYNQQGWINPITKKYIEKLARVIDQEFNTLYDAFAEPDTFFNVDDFSADLNDLMVPFKNRASLLLNIPELDSFDANNPTEESQTPILSAISDYQTKISNLRNSLSQLSNGPTINLLDNFIVDLTGTAHVPLSKLLDNAEALMSSKSLSQFTGLDLNVEAGLKQALVATELMQAYLEGARTTNAGYTETPNMLAGTELGGEGAFLDTNKLNFNTTGINKMLNDIHKQVKEQAKKAPKVSDDQKVEEEEWEDLPLLDGIVADSILQDLTLINRRIHFILDLLEINKGQKLNEQIRINVNTAYLRYKAIQKLIDVAPDDWDKEALEQAQLQTMKIEQYMSKDDKLTLNDDEQYELDKAIIALEDAVYDFFNSAENKNKDLKDLLQSKNGLGFNIYTRSEGLLTESTEVFDDVTTWWYLAQLRAVKSSDFYRTQYESLGQGNIVPLDTQLLLAKLHVANASNGDAMTEMQEALHDYFVENLKSLDYDTRVQKINDIIKNEQYSKLFAEDSVIDYMLENLQIVPKFSNITFGEGVPGAGKTVGSSKTLVQVLATHPSTKPLLEKVAVISTTPDIAKKLGESLELENAQSFDRHSFLTSISNWKAPKEKNGITEFVKDVDYKIGKNNKLEHAYEIKADADIPSLIIIDEVSRFSDFELQLIDEFAKKNGISVVAYGDFNQTQTIGNVKLDVPNLQSELGNKYKTIIKGNYLEFNAALDRNNLMHGPKLGSTLRTANIQKTWNTAAMQSYVQEPSGPLKLRYYQGVVPGKPGTIIAGDKVYTVDNKIKNENGVQTPVGRKYRPEIINNILADIDIMLSSLTDGEHIGYIYSDTTSDLYKALFEDDGKTLRDKYKGKIKPYYGTTAQSQEAQYFIIETDVTKTENDQAFIQDLYTSVTRSQVGSIVIAPPKFGKSGIIINNVGSPDTVYTEEGITNESKTRYINRKKKIMNKLFKDVNLEEHHVEYIPRKKKTTNPPGTNPVNPPSNPPSNPPTPPTNNPPAPVNPSTGPALLGVTPNPTNDTTKLTFEENKGILGYNHSFGENGEQTFGFGDYTMKENLPVISQEWLEAVGIDPSFKYLTGITVSATGKITLNLLDENDGTLSIELPDGTDITTLTDGVLNLLNPPLKDDSEDPEVDPDEGNETVIPETENPQELDEAAEATRPRSVRTTIIERGKKRLNRKKQQDEIRKSFEFAELLFSFNSFEDYGYTINNNGEIEPKEGLDAEIAKHRIDGINGLIRIAEKYDRCRFDGKNGQVAENILGRIASAALHGQSLNDISRQVSQVLFGGQDVCRVKCDFALKCSPRLAEGKDYFDTSGAYAQYERKSTEHSKFNDATDPVSQDAYRKQIVLNIELDGKPALEVPVVLLNSALSILQMKQDGDPVYSELLSVWDPETSSLSIHDGVLAILDAFDNKDYPQYRTLMNLFRLFNFTMPGYFRVNKEFETNGKKYDLRNWTVGKDLLNLGCRIEIERGINSINGHNVYEQEWVPIDVVTRDTRKTVSEIYTTSNAILSDNGTVIAKSGNNFVLISDDKSIPENRLWEIFKADQNKPIGERTNKVSIYYVLPPQRSFGQYMISLRDFCSQPGGKTQPIGNNMTIYNVFSGIRAVLGDSAFDDIFQHGQFENGGKVCENVKLILDELKRLHADNESSKEASIFIQTKRENGNGESNERYLLSTLKELIWPLGINEYGGRDTSGYGIFKLDMFNLLEDAFNQSNVIIYDSSNIKQGSNGEIKPVKVKERYVGYSRPTVYTGEATNALKPGDAIFDENADDNWHMNGKISTSEFETKENNEDFGAFLNYAIRDSVFVNKQDGQSYQKHGKYGDGDVEYYETARADVSPQPPVQPNDKLTDRVMSILREMEFTDEDIETLKQFDDDNDIINFINEKLIERKQPYILIPFSSNNGLDGRIIGFKKAFPGLYAVKLPENVVYDGNGIVSANITLSDGSIQRVISDKTKQKSDYSQIKGPDISNPQPAPPNPISPAPTSYIIGSNRDVADDELKAASILLFNNKKQLTIETLDTEIRNYIDKLRSNPKRLNSVINALNTTYKNNLLRNNFRQTQISNIEGMISEINRYAQYSPDQNEGSCNNRTA